MQVLDTQLIKVLLKRFQIFFLIFSKNWNKRKLAKVNIKVKNHEQVVKQIKLLLHKCFSLMKEKGQSKQARWIVIYH